MIYLNVVLHRYQEYFTDITTTSIIMRENHQRAWLELTTIYWLLKSL